MNQKIHPINKIHNINYKLNKYFSMPLYIIGGIMTVVLFFSPYFIRLTLAFLVNIFFNRPTVYLSIFSKFIGKKINYFVLSIFYISIFGIYGILYKFFGLFGKRKNNSTWIKKTEINNNDLYYYQS